MINKRYSVIILILSMIILIPHICSERLSTIYKPNSYEVSLRFPESTLTTLENNAFEGTVTIHLNLTQDTDEIMFHMSHEHLEIMTLTVDGSSRKYLINNETNVVTVPCLQGFAASITHVIQVGYRGVLSTSELLGVYKSSYENSLGETHYIVTTMAAPLSTRAIFPCFDEPNFKATFKIDITLPSGYTAICNTAVQETQELSNTEVIYYFETTPLMSSYLIAFVVSDFSCNEVTADNVAIQVCSRKESISDREWTITYEPKVLTVLEEYTNIPYSTVLNKIGFAAVGDFAFDAMENWGLPIMSESTLLWDRCHSSNSHKIFVTRKLTHVTVHLWFGNLVTLDWWSDTYINEAFAAYFEYYIQDKVQPEWQLKKQYNIDVLHASLLNDGQSLTPALSSTVDTTEEILLKIVQSYNKGGSILQMLMYIMGEEEIKAGLQNYLSIYSYKNVFSADLWTALEPSINATKSLLPATLDVVMENWIEKPGYPIITAKLKNGIVTLSQERYLLTGTDNTRWYVPISYTVSTDEEKFVNTLPQRWLTPNADLTITLPTNANWIIFNNQQKGYYRVNYDQTLWKRIQNALSQQTFHNIHEMNRVQIVDDIFNLARIRKTSYQNVFNVIDFIKYDTSYYTWTVVFNGFGFFLDRVGPKSALGKASIKYLLNAMKSVQATVPFASNYETDMIYTLKQVLVNKWACKLQQTDCVEKAKAQFQAFKYLGIRPSKNMIAIVYCTALSASSDHSDWELVWNEYLKSDVASEKGDLLTALSCSTQRTILEKLLDLTISEEKWIRPQDRSTVFSSIVGSSSIGFDVAFKFLQENYDKIALHYQDISSLPGSISVIAKKINNKKNLNKLTNLIDKIPQKYKTAALASIEEVNANLKWNNQQTLKLYSIKQFNINLVTKVIAYIAWIF